MDFLHTLCWGFGFLFFPRTTIATIVWWFFWGPTPFAIILVVLGFLLDLSAGYRSGSND